MKQTAVQLLKEALDYEIKSGTKMVVNWDMYLEIEKEQMMDAHLKADVFPRKYEFEQYYNETYGSKGSDEVGSSLEWNGEVTQGSNDQVPDVRKMVEDDNYLTPVDWLMDRIKWIHRETYDYLIKEGQYDVAKRTENAILDKTNELQSSQTEISDEEIQEGVDEHFSADDMVTERFAFKLGANWYKALLKSKKQ